MTDDTMDRFLSAGNDQITERKWDAVEESNAGSVAVLSKSAGVGSWAAGTWIANNKGGWERKL